MTSAAVEHFDIIVNGSDPAGEGAAMIAAKSRRRFYDRNRVPVLAGAAWVADPHTVEVRSPSAGTSRVIADHIVIAAGSRPYHPPELDFTHPRLRDSDSVLQYADNPFAVTICGAGIIGCEYAWIFVNLGCKVTLINTHERLLSFLDEEIAEALSCHLREQGCVIRHNEKLAAIETRPDDVVLQLESGRRVRSNVLSWANGRTGNTDHRNREALGLVPDGRGQLCLNAHFQTVMSGRDINTPKYFVATTCNYRTMAEAYPVAAYNGLKRLA
jgi:NAD(P) transhydrogenase